MGVGAADISVHRAGRLGPRLRLNREADLVIAEPKHHGAYHIWQEVDVIDLFDDAADLQTVFYIAGAQVDDADRALGADALGLQPLIKGQAPRRSGSRADGKFRSQHGRRQRTGRGRSRAGSKSVRTYRFPVDPAKLAGARLQHPQCALMQPWRMRHRKPFGHHLTGWHLQDHAAIAALLAPALKHVGS